MRNQGGSIGIALVSTMLQRKAQLHEQMLGQHITVSNGLVQQHIARAAASPGNFADHRYFAMSKLYQAMQRRAMLLSYMDQFRILCGIILGILRLVLFLRLLLSYGIRIGTTREGRCKGQGIWMTTAPAKAKFSSFRSLFAGQFRVSSFV
jgi:hypothetical protein